MSEVTEAALLAPRALPSPDEVMAVVAEVDAAGLATPGLLDLCRLYGIAMRGVESAQVTMASFGDWRGWQRERVERAARTVAAFASLDDSANNYIDLIRASLPQSALARVWWQ